MRLRGTRYIALLFLLFTTISAIGGELKIEAEKAQLVGSATVHNITLCSEGRKVGNMGGPPDAGGIQFNYSMDVEGTCRIDIYYLAGEQRYLEILVNDQLAETVSCPSTGGWDIPGVISVEINLPAGESTLLITNSISYAPDLDVIIISPLDNSGTIEDHTTFTSGRWQLKVDNNTGKTDILIDGKVLLNNSGPAFMSGSVKYFMEELTGLTIQEIELNDETGSGKQIVLTATTLDEKITVEQNFYLYPEKDFMLTDLSIESSEVLQSNYMAPILTRDSVEVLPQGENKALWVPYDNDKWVRYHTLGFGTPITGHEVAVLFNETSRNGLVVGSVQHDTWKTGINITTRTSNYITRLEAAAGITSNETRDVLPHGAVKGTRIVSPKIFVGYFADWRRGMELYGDINEQYAPKLPWAGGKPFLWNSWGAIQTRLSYQNATEVSEYIEEKLQPNNFQNDGTVYINLDSYWDNITYSNLKRFVTEVKARGQEPGIYWTPFVDWANNPDRLVEGTSDVYYRDIYLYANGNPQEIAGAWAIDPTHPASKTRMNLYLDRFMDQGFTFLKLDFLCHGALEGDSFHDPEVQTGIQAFNQGMQYIIDRLNGSMYINLSIAPLFPSQYGHSRRIACDAYANIDNTEYTLNSLTYGWWLDHVYSYNDADNVVLNGVSLGENRARVTSSVITGIFCIGDDLSSDGYASAKTRAEEFLTNSEVNRIARLTKSFYPVETADGSSAGNIFMQTAGDTTYLAIFNYSTSTENKLMESGKIALVAGKEYVVHDLWNNEKEVVSGNIEVTVPRRDVKLLKIYEGSLVPNEEIPLEETGMFYPNPCNSEIHLGKTLDPATKVIAYNSMGQVVKIYSGSTRSLDVSDLTNGLYFFYGIDLEGNVHVGKIIKES